ncbi:hypothetical protein GH733_001698 [Mirounga leonina]|nr:hypothetical protein GH733_001698 [Mirounga leonina]
MKHSQKTTFYGEGDQEPGLEPGNIITVLDQKDHDVFTHLEEDLFMGQTVKHGDIKCVLDEGMLIYHRPYEKSRLIIELKMNDSLSIFQGSWEECNRKNTEDAALKELTQTKKEKEQKTDEEHDLLRFKFKLQNKADTKRKECKK